MPHATGHRITAGGRAATDDRQRQRHDDEATGDVELERPGDCADGREQHHGGEEDPPELLGTDPEETLLVAAGDDDRRIGAGAALPTRGGVVGIPKFASLCRTLVCELRNRRTLATY